MYNDSEVNTMKDNRDVFSRNLSKFIKIKNKTQMDIVNDLGVSQSTVSGWINGKKYPRIDRLQQIADYFGVYKSELTEDKSYFMDTYGYRIPVLGIVPCGIPVSAVEDIIGFEEVSASMVKNGSYFGLKARGDSMNPVIMDGDTIIVRQQPNIESGQIGIIKVNGDEATCKKVVKKDHSIVLVPANDLFNTVEYNAEQVEKLPVQIIGRVVEIRRSI